MFKTRKSDGRVFNDNKQRSDKHHGSVKPTDGIKAAGMQGNRELEDDHTSGIKTIHGWTFMKYPDGANIDVKHSLYVKLKKDNRQIELSENQYRNGGYNIKIDNNTPNGYDSVRFLVKNRDDAIKNVEALMRMI